METLDTAEIHINTFWRRNLLLRAKDAFSVIASRSSAMDNLRSGKQLCANELLHIYERKKEKKKKHSLMKSI